jgi:Zn finger protein HypA/HybF involved in hydrogenase expression
MVTIVKHEWHQVDEQYAIELDESLLSEIYPDLDEDEIRNLLTQIENGEVDIEDVIDEAWENDIDIDWDHQYSDCWTARKGGYDVTYELGDEDSWHTPTPPPKPTHKCTKCRWEGFSYQTTTEYLREDGTVIEDYYSSEEESDITKETCPMCDGDTELTEVGVKEKQERDERNARWAAEEDEEDEDDSPERVAEMQAALEELKLEFEELMSHTIKCTECDWTGREEQCEKEGICPNCAAHTQSIDNEE